jgi:RNA polymerase sigma factor (sigma-70 family)
VCTRKPPPPAQELFYQAYARAGRAADVHAAALIGVLHDAAMDRQDLQQEVLISIWAALPRYDPTRAGLNTFVEAIAATTVVSICRRARAAKRVRPADYNLAEPLHILVRVELGVDLRRVLRQLGRRERRVARLLVEDGPVKIARQLNISRAAVYRSIGRIRAALRQSGFSR